MSGRLPCLGQFYICPKLETDMFSNLMKLGISSKHIFGSYAILTDGRTPIQTAQSSDFSVFVFGYAVNVHTGSADNLAEELISNVKTPKELIEREKKLGGKYIIIFQFQHNYGCICDATSSLPLFYTFQNGEMYCASSYKILADRFQLTPNKGLQKIRNCSDISQAMPYDITIYGEIRQLLPNHVLSLTENKAFRFVNISGSSDVLTSEMAAEQTLPYIMNLAKYYASITKINCPITSGRDSRAVLAAMLSATDSCNCYTIRHGNFSEKEQDITVPREIAKKLKLTYNQVCDEVVPHDIEAQFDKLMGKGQYSARTLMIAYTVYVNSKEAAVVNGDIIGQVGKCSLHRDIPTRYATPSYFRYKLHNYSHESKSFLKAWLEEIRETNEAANLFDLFSIENRLGRWAAQENQIYNAMGQLYINIFNSRSIIYPWTCTDRSARKNSEIHRHLICALNIKLLDVPFQSEKSVLVRLSKASWRSFLIAGYIKHYISGVKFFLREYTSRARESYE